MSDKAIALRGDRYDPHGDRFWQPIDFCDDFDRRPSEIRAAIERLGIPPKHDFGDNAKLYGVDAFRALRDYFQDEEALGGGPADD